MRERGSASVDPALRVALRAGGRTRQRRSPAGTRRADNEQKRVTEESVATTITCNVAGVGPTAVPVVKFC